MVTMTPTRGITDIADVLRQLGVDVRRVGEKEISGRCPVHVKHTGKEDRSPSWSMNASTGLWICYACGARGTLSHLVSELTGEPDTIVAVHSFLVTNGLNRLTQSEDTFPRISLEQQQAQQEVNWRTFSAFDVPSDARIAERNLDRDAIRKYGIRWDKERQAWVIPITSPLGDLMGWQIKAKNYVRNYPIGVEKSTTLFGIDQVNFGTCLLVESPLDVVRINTCLHGVSGLASFGAHISLAQARLLSEFAESLIIALDNDEAGIAATKKLMNVLPAFRNPVRYLQYSHTKAKDIGDMTDAEAYEAVQGASVFPWWLKRV